jgi:serine/threonine protein kinase
MELAAGGELFSSVSQTGKFEEQLARYFFRQIIEAIEFCHSR